MLVFMWTEPAAADPTLSESSLMRRDAVGTMRTPHRHGAVEFNLVLAGTATYLLSDRRYDLAANSLVWLFPGQDHLMIQVSPGYRDWLGLISRSALEAWGTASASAPLLAQDPPGHHVRRLSAKAASRLDSLLRHVATSSPTTAIPGRVFATLAAWDVYLAADRSTPPERVHPEVREAMRILSTDDPPQDLRSLAARVALSPHHLSRIFRQETGVSITRFRNEQRLRTFIEKYEASPEQPILDLALASGFGSAAQFHRVFKELTGTTPASYLNPRA